MIVVGTTIAPWKCDGKQELAWLKNADAISESVDDEVKFFAALEVDGRGMSPYRTDLVDMLDDYWRFAFDDGEASVKAHERLIRICTGRNMVQEYAQREQASHILFCDSDITQPDDVLPKLLELGHPITGANVGIYALDGPRIIDASSTFNCITYAPRERKAFPEGAAGDHAYTDELWLCAKRGSFARPYTFPVDADVRVHWNTAGSLLVAREVFTRIAWNSDLDSGNSDDPAYQRNVRELLRHDTWVRHDIQAKHVPIPMVGVEHRPGDKRHRNW